MNVGRIIGRVLEALPDIVKWLVKRAAERKVRRRIEDVRTFRRAVGERDPVEVAKRLDRFLLDARVRGRLDRLRLRLPDKSGVPAT